jgi:hypothetical protein
VPPPPPGDGAREANAVGADAGAPQQGASRDDPFAAVARASLPEG